MTFHWAADKAAANQPGKCKCRLYLEFLHMREKKYQSGLATSFLMLSITTLIGLTTLIIISILTGWEEEGRAGQAGSEKPSQVLQFLKDTLPPINDLHFQRHINPRIYDLHFWPISCSEFHLLKPIFWVQYSNSNMTCIIQLSQTIYSNKLVAFNVTLDHLQSDQSLSYLLNFFSRNRSLTRKHQLLHYPHALRFQNKE